MNAKSLFQGLNSSAQFFAMRYSEEKSDMFVVRQGRAEPFTQLHDRGVMLTVIDQGGYGYAATSDLSQEGLQHALDTAHRWALASASQSVAHFDVPADAAPKGRFDSPVLVGLPGRRQMLDMLLEEDAATRFDPRIVDSRAAVTTRAIQQHYLTSAGGDVAQHFHFIMPSLSVTASDGKDTQTRNMIADYCQQGGFEVVQRAGFAGGGRRTAEEALALLEAPNCPSGSMDLLLAPDQMMLQIHESIGHPLELDRILGDERNFAGTSFVTMDMFGTYQYGSEHLNVTFDPDIPEQLASYAFDDEGTRAQRQYLIKGGILERPLGGALSQQRASALTGHTVEGVANTRAANWNRPPIDRMANINIEPGHASFDDLVAQVEHGVLMRTNLSWSIDDSRNKFQFGCEWGQLIENGKLTTVVKNPNYRGISANFWRSLKAVGDASTRQVMGTPYCGKGEPSQVIRVGHASPVCLFAGVDVFGGEA